MSKIYFYLLISISCLGFAGPLIRFCDANPIMIAFYRMLLASILIFPFAVKGYLPVFKHFTWKLYLLLFSMALLFSGHLLFWIEGVQHTKVANATIVFALNPVFASLAAHFFLKEKIGRHQIFAIILGILGVAILGLDDISLSNKYFYGDMMALTAGVFFGLYFVAGKPLRSIPELNNITLMSMIYLFGSILTLILVLILDLPIHSLSTKTISAIVALVLFPTILGHILLIYILKYLPASSVSTATFLEPIIGGTAAYFLFQEETSWKIWFGYILIVLGLVLLMRFQMNKGHNRA